MVLAGGGRGGGGGGGGGEGEGRGPLCLNQECMPDATALSTLSCDGHCRLRSRERPSPRGGDDSLLEETVCGTGPERWHFAFWCWDAV